MFVSYANLQAATSSYTLKEIRKIAVIGAGTMGSGIAQMSALSGHQTLLYDIDASRLEKAVQKIAGNLDGGIKRGKLTQEEKDQCLALIRTTDDLLDLKADFIVEAIVEKLHIKVDLFKQLSALNDSDAIFATNTSSIPITRIAAGVPHPERVVGMHFFNPAHIMKLVEVISGAATSPAVAQATFELAKKMGKKAVMAKDAPGFIVNRVARQFYLESLKALEEGVASVETIDAIIENNGFRMGPFKLMDLIGVETNHSVTTSMFDSFFQEARFKPSRIQQQKVDAGQHGRKTGHGFYEYPAS